MKKNFLYAVLLSLVIVVLAHSFSLAGGTYPEFTVGNLTSYSGGNRITDIEESLQGVPKLKEIQITLKGAERFATKRPIPEGKIPNSSNGLVNANSPIILTANGNNISFTHSIGTGDFNHVRMINSKGRTVAKIDDKAMERVDFQHRTLNVKLSSGSENYYVEFVNEYKGVIYECYYVLLNIKTGKEVYKHNNEPARDPKDDAIMKEYMQSRGITNESDLTGEDYENLVEMYHDRADTPEEKLFNSITKDYMRKNNISSRSKLTESDYDNITAIFQKEYMKKIAPSKAPSKKGSSYSPKSQPKSKSSGKKKNK